MKYKHTLKGPKTLNEWVEAYEERQNEKVRIFEDGQHYWIPERGFVTLIRNDNEHVIEIIQLCGDGKYWLKFLTVMLEGMPNPELWRLRARTSRNPETWIKRYGAKIVGTGLHPQPYTAMEWTPKKEVFK